MRSSLIESRFATLDAIGNALKKKGRVSFAEASSLRDLARAGRTEEVKDRLTVRTAGASLARR